MQYVRAIYAYMGFAGFSIFFVLAGIILIELLQTWHVHLDFISFVYVLWNFAVRRVFIILRRCSLQLRKRRCHECTACTAFACRW